MPAASARKGSTAKNIGKDEIHVKEAKDTESKTETKHEGDYIYKLFYSFIDSFPQHKYSEITAMHKLITSFMKLSHP